MKKLLLFVSLFCLANTWAYNFTVDGIYYYYQTSGSDTLGVEVTYKIYDDYSGAINIPDSVSYNGNKYAVTSIGNYAFKNCSTLTSVSIPESVTEISNMAFYRCSSLTSVSIPQNVTSIGDWAFQYCTSLSSISIPEGVTSIGHVAFSHCTSLSSVNISSSVTYLGDSVFAECQSLTSLTVLNPVPVAMYSTGFCYVDQSACTLYVPCGSGSAYGSADVWKEFNIVESSGGVSYLINDTTTYHVSDLEYQAISPEMYYKTTDSLKSQCDADSIVNHYTQYVFDANYYTDTTHVTVNDTTFFTVNDTAHVIVNDTNFVTTTDTSYVTVVDTNYVTITDTAHVTVMDTSFVTITDTNYISVEDTLIITKAVTSLKSPNNKVTIKMYPNPAKDYVVISLDDYTMINSYNLIITNASGQQVYSALVNKSEYSINVQDIGGAGLYVVTFKDTENNLFVSKRLLVE